MSSREKKKIDQKISMKFKTFRFLGEINTPKRPLMEWDFDTSYTKYV